MGYFNKMRKYLETESWKTAAERTEFMSNERRIREKDERETLEFFMFEIDRVGKNIKNARSTGEYKDEIIARNSEQYLKELVKRMQNKFSPEEIESAKKSFDKRQFAKMIKEHNAKIQTALKESENNR